LSGFIETQTVALGQPDEQISTVQFISKKPSYTIGAAQSLRTRKPVTAEVAAPSVWAIDEDDDDLGDIMAESNPEPWKVDEDDPMDEDSLLQDIDKQVVSVLPVNDDCEKSGGKSGACKNCTCGRADMDEEQLENTKSSCGNCYLGDAFRCATCPYLGQPAFKPGERVTLSNN